MPAVGPDGVQLTTGTFVELLGAHVVAVQLLPELAAAGVQLATPVGPVVLFPQVVAV